MKKTLFALLLLLVFCGHAHAGGIVNPSSDPTGAYIVAACTGSHDEVALASAETVAYAAGTKILIPNGQGRCNIQGQWKIVSPSTHIFRWPSTNDFYSPIINPNKDDYIAVLNGSGGVSSNSTNNCAIDLNGHLAITVENVSFSGNYFYSGTVLFCNSYNGNRDGNVPLFNLQRSNFGGFGNIVGCATTNQAANGTTQWDLCTGSLGANTIFVRANQINVGNSVSFMKGHTTDAMVKNSEISTVGSAISCNGSDGTVCTALTVLGNRIEWSGAGYGSAKIVRPALDLGCTTYMTTVLGNQFDFNGGEDIHLGGDSACLSLYGTRGLGSRLIVGNSHHNAGSSGSIGHMGFYTFDQSAGMEASTVISGEGWNANPYDSQLPPNVFLNPTAPVTQDIYVVPQEYKIIIVGSGSATLSGAATGGPYSEGTNTFTPASTGTMTVTISGTPTSVTVQPKRVPYFIAEIAGAYDNNISIDGAVGGDYARGYQALNIAAGATALANFRFDVVGEPTIDIGRTINIGGTIASPLLSVGASYVKLPYISAAGVVSVDASGNLTGSLGTATASQDVTFDATGAAKVNSITGIATSGSNGVYLCINSSTGEIYAKSSCP